jgi:hypothetical protein
MPLVLLIFLIVSYLTRPASRRLAPVAVSIQSLLIGDAPTALACSQGR